ncbi:MAG: glycosyltransferase family 4 protein [Pseudomonadota bacterium]
MTGPMVLMLVALMMSMLMTRFLIWYALRQSLIDCPNERSSHVIPTPRGGGLSIGISCMLGLVVLGISSYVALNLAVAFAGAGFLVAAVGFWDDHGHVPPKRRVAMHFIAAIWALCFVSGSVSFFHLSLLGWFFNVFLVVSVVWVLNLYNFMDGIDSIAAAEAIFVGGSAAAFFYASGATGLALFSILLVVSTAGFLVWNLPPARVFMGDAGSGFLGVMIGMLALAGIKGSSVNIWVWLILLGVFLVDATLTVARRMARGTRWFEAHRSHAYQHAAQRWNSHGKVTMAVFAINVLWLLPWAIAAWRLPHLGPLFAAIAFAPLVWGAFKLGAGKG